MLARSFASGLCGTWANRPANSPQVTECSLVHFLSLGQCPTISCAFNTTSELTDDTRQNYNKYAEDCLSVASSTGCCGFDWRINQFQRAGI